ncbi:MAG TPA: hypothetical protein VFV71_04095 [Burkholderiales bacterium]|nr:hypothetical protein [Burkholderiales bacterium]
MNAGGDAMPTGSGLRGGVRHETSIGSKAPRHDIAGFLPQYPGGAPR